MPYEFSFDYMRFEKLMVESYSPYYEELKQKHAPDKIFGYTLVAFAEFEIMEPMCITDKNSDWSNCYQPQWRNARLPDMGLFEMIVQFGKVQSRLKRASRRFANVIIAAREEGISEEEIEVMKQPLLAEYRQACINALKKMDANGVFGTGEEREKITVFLGFSSGRVLIRPDS